MSNPVVIDFIIKGMPDVNRALGNVQDAAARAEAATTRRTEQEAKKRQRAAEKEAKAKIAAMMKADKWQRQAQDKAERDTARALRKKEKDEERSMRAMVREAEKSARDRQRIEDKVEREWKRMQQRRLRENERIEREATRIHDRELKARQRADFIRARDEMRNRRRFAGAVGMAGAQGLGRGARVVGGFARQTMGMMTGIAGDMSISGSVQRNAQNEGALSDLLNAGVNRFSSVRENSRKRDRGEMEGVLDSATTTYGMERGDAIAGLRSFTSSTGDLATATKLLPKLAELSRATGASLEDMTGAAGKAGLAFGDMTDSSKKAEKIMQVMRVIAGQGKAGSVEAKDMATQMGKLVATAGKFEGDNVENLAKMGMLAQFAAGGGGAWSGKSAATAVTQFGAVFGKEARVQAFKKEGVDVFTDKSKTKVRAPEQIIADAFEKTGGNKVKINQMFGSVMAARAVDQFGTVFSKGYTDASGKQTKGKDAILAYAKDMTATTMTEKEVTGAWQDRSRDADVKMAQVQANFDKAVRERVLPALMKLIPEFEKMVPLFVDLNAKALPAFIQLIKTVGEFAQAHKGIIDSIAAHPIGAIMAAEVTKSMGQAALGQLIANGLQRGFGDAGMGAVMNKVLKGSLAAGITVAAAAIAIQQGMIAIDKEYKKEDDLRAGGRNNQIEAARLTARIQRGTATPAERKKAAELVGGLQGDIKATAEQQANPGFFKKVGGGLAGLTDAGKEAQKLEAAQQKRQMDDLAKALRDLQTALNHNTAATKADTAGGGDGANVGPGGDARKTNLANRPAGN